ncbi:glycine oxidase ThiO [Paenibacillus sambharensis]|uniref:glycine oxidase n=1 Tax=Paenibacillus sambharensis TaxID=1803190 RepID=A0A2W1L783_9BACL|nr:glycine oxidase ThiO [Paenibacillus sambharensis]PZD95126.1 glycine oxidase ThiO [Paenibacillus sambharensis]
MAEHILVLGGGIIGLSCAFTAAERGFRVTVVEPHMPGGQASGAAAGMLAPFSENPEQPDDFFHLCRESLKLYPGWINRIEAASGEKIEWHETGSLNVVYHEADINPLYSRILWQNRYGADARLVMPEELREMEPALSHDVKAAVYYPHESHVYAPGLVAALEKACIARGVTIVCQAGDVEDVRVSDSGIAVTTANAGDLWADRLVVCAGAWSGLYERWFGITVPVHPIRGQICAYEVPFGEVRHMIFSPQAYWTSKANGTLVCGASEDVAGFDTSVTDKGIGRLVRYGPKTLPMLEQLPVVHRWAGLRPATRDGRPLLGFVSGMPQVVMAAGHYRNGILLSPVTAEAVVSLLEGRPAPVPLTAFSPGRFTAVAGGGRFR